MRKALITALLPLAACGMANTGGDSDATPGVPGQGSGGTRTYAISGFTGIDSRGSDDVDVRVGPGFSVRADGDPKLLDQLKLSLEGNTLRISRQGRNGWSWSGKGAHISVTMPRLAEVAIAGSGDMTVDHVAGAGFKAAGAGSGDLSVATLQVERADVSLAGSGNVKLAGTVRQLAVNLAGSGDVDAGGLRAAEAEVSVAGSGNVRASVDGPAKVSLLGSGDVDLGDGARCRTSKMGSGSVRCGN